MSYKCRQNIYYNQKKKKQELVMSSYVSKLRQQNTGTSSSSFERICL